MTTKKIIGLGTVCYLLLIPFFYHPDLKIIYYLANFLSAGVGNIYAYISTHPGAANLGNFVYPPAAYFSLGLLAIVIKPLAGESWASWLGMGNDAVNTIHLFRYLFLMKLPLVAAHSVSALLLVKLVADEKRKKLLALLWFFNPVSIYVVVMMGQIDGLAALTVIAAVVLASKKPYLAALLLGIGAAIKTFPLLFLPLLLIFIPGNLLKRLWVGIIGGLSYLIWIGPYLTTPAFYSSTLVSGLSQRVFHYGPLIPALILGLYVLGWIRYRGQIIFLPRFILAVGLVVMAGINFNPQWLLWVAPWVCWYAVSKRDYYLPLLWAMGAAGLILAIPDKFLTWGLFSALEPGILFLSSPATLLSINLSLLARIVMVAAAVAIIVKSLKIQNV